MGGLTLAVATASTSVVVRRAAGARARVDGRRRIGALSGGIARSAPYRRKRVSFPPGRNVDREAANTPPHVASIKPVLLGGLSMRGTVDSPVLTDDSMRGHLVDCTTVSTHRITRSVSGTRGRSGGPLTEAAPVTSSGTMVLTNVLSVIGPAVADVTLVDEVQPSSVASTAI